jgi:hypothetical protein
MSSRLRVVAWGLSAILVSLVCGTSTQNPTATANDDDTPPISVQQIALLRLPKKDRHPEICAFRSAAIRFPWVYVVDRCGSLCVFQLTDTERMGPLGSNELNPARVVPDVGDGYDVAVVDDALYFTADGVLRVFSLVDPAIPTYVGQVGSSGGRLPNGRLVVNGERAYIIGGNRIVTYDISRRTKPDEVSTHVGRFNAWSGCVVARYLYVGGRDDNKDACVIAFLVTNDGHLQQVGLVKLPQMPYHLFQLSQDKLIATTDSDTAVVVNIADPTSPQILRLSESTGGRSCALVSTAKSQVLIDRRFVTLIEAEQTRHLVPGYSIGSCADGFPYHGDVQGTHAVIATDRCAVVYEVTCQVPHVGGDHLFNLFNKAEPGESDDRVGDGGAGGLGGGGRVAGVDLPGLRPECSRESDRQIAPSTATIAQAIESTVPPTVAQRGFGKG